MAVSEVARGSEIHPPTTGAVSRGPQSALAIRADCVIDGVSDNSIDDGVVLIEDGLIKAVGPAARIQVRRGTPRVDLGSRALLPGLIDVHVHLLGARSYQEMGQLYHDQELATLRAARDAERLLDAGFTTVRDCGSLTALALKRAAAEGTVRAPRIYAAGPVLCQTGGHVDLHHVPLEVAKTRRISSIVDSPWEARRAVREAVRAGADLVKICTTGGIGSEMDDPRDVHFTPDEIAAVVDEAHRARRRVASHSQGKEGIMAAVLGGVDSIEHGYFLDEECADAMLARGTHLVPTFALLEVFKRSLAEPHDMPAWRLRKQQQAIAAMEASFEVARERRLLIATGSDYLGTPLRQHGDNADEPITMVRHGMPEMQAIRAATSNAARVIGIEEFTGSLVPGRWADLVAVATSPLDSVSALREVELVVQGGRIVKNRLEPQADSW